MKIKAVFKKRKSKGYCLITSEDEFFDISEDLIVRYALKKGIELDDELFKEIILKQKLINSKQYAYSYASYKPRTIRQVSEKLKLLNFEPEVIDESIKFLKEFNLLDDEKFASGFIESYLKRKPSGAQKIYLELVSKGISKDLAKLSVAEHFPEDDKFELANKAAEKKMRMLSSKSPEKQKSALISYLQRQGFEWDVIKKIADSILKR